MILLVKYYFLLYSRLYRVLNKFIRWCKKYNIYIFLLKNWNCVFLLQRLAFWKHVLGVNVIFTFVFQESVKMMLTCPAVIQDVLILPIFLECRYTNVYYLLSSVSFY